MGGGKKYGKIFKPGDLILLAVLIVSIVLTIVFSLGEEAPYAEIYIDGKLAYQLDLRTDKTLDILDGGMRVEIKDGKAYVSYSDCSEQLCVHSSPVSSEGGMIVCLPNRVVIKVSSGEVDAIT